MSTSTFRTLAKVDSDRIGCQINDCHSQATRAETLNWNTGNTGGTSFFYYCDEHAKEQEANNETTEA